MSELEELKRKVAVLELSMNMIIDAMNTYIVAFAEMAKEVDRLKPWGKYEQ